MGISDAFAPLAPQDGQTSLLLPKRESRNPIFNLLNLTMIRAEHSGGRLMKTSFRFSGQAIR
jgi:hypothetical protein